VSDGAPAGEAQRHRRAPLIAPAAVEGPTKFGAARISLVSNSMLIVLKVIAGAITGSIAIITEAVHSSIDLLASIVAYLSLRKADEPADSGHMYGHAKVENIAAAIEGMLILVGAGVILYESVQRLDQGGKIEHIGVGIVVIGISAVVNVVVSTYLYRQARAHDSPALEGDAAHLRADAATSVAVLVGLVLIEVTGVEELDAIVALMVGSAIVYAGVRILSRSSRVLMDEALPPDELDVVRRAIRDFPGSELVGFHKLRGRRAGSARHIDLHLQFAPGTSLERAHAVAHQLQEAVRRELPSADLLIHMEPSRRQTRRLGGEEQPP
jgi:cation diffusion facilitator family transporter